MNHLHLSTTLTDGAERPDLRPTCADMNLWTFGRVDGLGRVNTAALVIYYSATAASTKFTGRGAGGTLARTRLICHFPLLALKMPKKRELRL